MAYPVLGALLSSERAADSICSGREEVGGEAQWQRAVPSQRIHLLSQVAQAAAELEVLSDAELDALTARRAARPVVDDEAQHDEWGCGGRGVRSR